jgi:predicted transcriptional regulator
MEEVREKPATNKDDLLRMTASIVAAYVSHNTLPSGSLSDLIRAVHQALDGVQVAIPQPQPELKPAVPVKKSVTPEYIICLEDGRKLKMLKRYLRTTYGITPDEYRAKWGLPQDYPMVAPNYADQRSAFAKRIGLGKRGRGGGKAK